MKKYKSVLILFASALLLYMGGNLTIFLVGDIGFMVTPYAKWVLLATFLSFILVIFGIIEGIRIFISSKRK